MTWFSYLWRLMLTTVNWFLSNTVGISLCFFLIFEVRFSATHIYFLYLSISWPPFISTTIAVGVRFQVLKLSLWYWPFLSWSSLFYYPSLWWNHDTYKSAHQVLLLHLNASYHSFCCDFNFILSSPRDMIPSHRTPISNAGYFFHKVLLFSLISQSNTLARRSLLILLGFIVYICALLSLLFSRLHSQPFGWPFSFLVFPLTPRL